MFLVLDYIKIQSKYNAFLDTNIAFKYEWIPLELWTKSYDRRKLMKYPAVGLWDKD